MINRFQRLIISSIIFGLIFSIAFNIFVTRPKQALATDGGAGFMNLIKETALDAVGWAVTDQVLKPLKQKIIDWGMGKQTDSNEPFFVIDWKAFFEEVKDLATGKLIQEIGATKLCTPFNVTIGNALTTSLNKFTLLNTDRSTFKTYAACTIDDIIENAEEFYKNPSIGIYGWDVWSILTKPNNNYLGMYYLMEEEEERLTDEETQAKDKETAVSEGVKNETITTTTDIDACIAQCDESQPLETYEACCSNCETTRKGIALETKVKNLGSTISGQMKEAMGADMSRIINADEISELIGVFFSAVLNKAIDGLGLVPSSANTTPIEKDRLANQELYGYGKSAEKAITPEIEKDIRTSVLTGILKGVRMIARATIKCEDKDTMLTDLDFNKNIADIFMSQLEALYTGVTGVNLKPDFTVLDSAYAPFSLYGFRWANIPANKIPAKCRKIVTQAGFDSTSTCKDISSGLEPNYNSNCTKCLYDKNELNCPPEPYPPLTTVLTTVWGTTIIPKVLTEETIKAKQDFYNKCQHWYGITTDRCIDCVKKADEKCGQEDADQKQRCIESVCNNYEDLKTHVKSKITSGIDFYNKCLVEETKRSCFTCLKEYFVPAEYCDTVGEFTARALIKYPAVVIQTSTDDGRSIGRYDQSIADAYKGAGEVECDNDADQKKPIALDLICRIMPDFEYNGKKVCQTTCMNNGMTKEELADIVDYRPRGKDCNNQTLNIGGRINVWSVVKDANFQQLTKCCAAAVNTSSYDQYLKCTGSSGKAKCSYATTAEKEPQCYCDEGYRPLGFTRTGLPRGSAGSGSALGGDCANIAMINWVKGTSGFVPAGRTVTGYTSNQPGEGDIYYIAQNSSCTETEDDWENATGKGTTDGADPDPAHHTLTATNWTTQINAPSNVLYSGTGKTQNADLTDAVAGKTGPIGIGVYHTQGFDLGDNDSGTGWHICAKCDPNDADYPYYGYEDKDGNPADQCTGKIK